LYKWQAVQRQSKHTLAQHTNNASAVGQLCARLLLQQLLQGAPGSRRPRARIERKQPSHEQGSAS
jgi:hypothetical protein